MPSWPSTTPMPTSRKDVQPSDHPARIFPHDHGTFWRAPRPIHRLRAHEWDRAWTEEAQPQQKPAEKNEPVGPWRIERSVSYTFTSTSTFRRSDGVQQLCTNANQILSGHWRLSRHFASCSKVLSFPSRCCLWLLLLTPPRKPSYRIPRS